METLEFIQNKFNIDPNAESPINIPLDRNGFATLLNDLGFKVGAEIGVDRGLYAENFCQKIPGVKLYCIDPWTTYQSTVPDPFANDQARQDRNFQETTGRLTPYGCVIMKKFSMEAIKEFAPNSLDFVFIDGNHDYDHVTEDMNEWYEIVKPGGIVSGHDYGRNRKYHEVGEAVTKAVDDYIKLHQVKKFFILPRKYCSNWFFIK
jgi:predicted O-methyltransferase YrrM